MYKSNDFWRETQIALDSGLYEKYWHLNMYEKAWLIAAVEMQKDLRLIIDEFGQDDDN